MSNLERAATALAIRPMLWGKLDPLVARVLRARIDDQAYTAIAQTIGAGDHWTPAMAKKYEEAGVALVLKHEKIAVVLDRGGYGNRWTLQESLT